MNFINFEKISNFGLLLLFFVAVIILNSHFEQESRIYRENI